MSANDEAKKAGGKSVTPEPVNIDLRACALTINATCGDCRHFVRLAHPKYGQACSVKGVIETAKPCSKFNPDARRVRFKDDESVVAFAQFMASVPTSKLAVLASLINREHRTRKHGFAFGEIVYLHLFGGDFISNYRRCRVVSVDKEYVHVEGGDGFVATVYPTSILNMRKWKKKRKELEAAKRVKDPNYKRYFENTAKASKEAARILDSLQPLPFNKSSAKNRRSLLATDDSGVIGKGHRLKRVVYNAKTRDLRTKPLDELIKPDAGLLRTRG